MKNGKWKLDIWSLTQEYLYKDHLLRQKILSKLTPQLKELILRLKFTLMAEDQRVPQLASYYIYQAIFEHNLLDKNAILIFLKDQGILI